MIHHNVKWQKFVPLSLALASALTTILAGGCGRGSKNEKGDTDEQGPSDPSRGGQPTDQSSANVVRISGQLNIGTLELTAAEKGVFAFTARAGNIGGEPKTVNVASDGTFSTEVMKIEDSVQSISKELDKPRDQRDWESMVRGAKSLLPDSDGLSVDQLRSMSDDELKSGLSDLVNDMKKSGAVTVLVAYEKSGNRVSEGQSFRFISLPTPGGKALSALPNERLRGNVDLGKISGSKRDVTSEAKSTDAFDLSAAALDSMADMGRALKNLTNSYMNSGWKAQPFYYWESTDKYTDVLDQFSSPAKSTYKGFGFYIGSIGDQGLTYDDLCGSKSITFTPPSPISVDGSNIPLTQYSNAGATGSNQGSNRICMGTGYYAREDDFGGQKSFMLNFGTGGSIKSSPQGLWSLKVGGQEVGRFDFGLASPIVDGNPTALIPRAKFTTSAGQVTGVEVELHRWTGSQYEKVEDLGGFRRLVSEMSAGITRNSDNKDLMTKLKIGEDNRITGVFDSSDTEQGEIRNPSVSTSDIRAFAVYYVIANASYRIEFRN